LLVAKTAAVMISTHCCCNELPFWPDEHHNWLSPCMQAESTIINSIIIPLLNKQGDMTWVCVCVMLGSRHALPALPASLTH